MYDVSCIFLIKVVTNVNHILPVISQCLANNCFRRIIYRDGRKLYKYEYEIELIHPTVYILCFVRCETRGTQSS